MRESLNILYTVTVTVKTIKSNSNDKFEINYTTKQDNKFTQRIVAKIVMCGEPGTFRLRRQ